MNTSIKRMFGAAALVLLSSPAYALHFTLASVSGSTWTYTLTFDPLDNYCVQGGSCTATITLAGLSGVTAATAPTSSDAPSTGAGNLHWIPIFQNGGPGVVWQMTSAGGTGDLSSTVHVFGFSVTAPGAVTGVVSEFTSQFCRNDGNPCTDLNIDTAVAGPVDPAVGSTTGSMSQAVTGGGWGTLFTLVNTGLNQANATLNFFANNGSPLSPSFGVLQSPTSSVSATLNQNASVVIDSSGDASPNRQEGWAQLLSTGTISGFGIFRFPATKWEAVVPIENRNAGAYILAFDNTGLLATGVAVANVSGQQAAIPVIIRDESGVQLAATTINLLAHGHTSFVLSDQYSATANRRGTVEFDTPGFGTGNAGQISIVGLRGNGPALTTLPVFANVGATGGNIAHTTFHGDFTSVFYVVNTGTSAAQFTMNFFDEAGNTLAVPLLPTQNGNKENTSSYSQNLAAGAMATFETVSQSSLPGVVGSAQLLTTGNISAFEVFRWVPFGQEASVPMETRTPSSFIVPFDNTNGLTTGVAIANNGFTLANIQMNIRDTSGTAIFSTAISIVPRGHTSFMLPGNYPAAANRRGTAEFVVPTIPLGQKISVIGLRAKADGTLTTIPVLAK